MRLPLLVAMVFVAMPLEAQQFNCDCTQIVGACEASIRVFDPTETGGQQIKSYGARLRITSTAPVCSKVSYYLDSTPYFNILSRGNHDEDSAFGTKPVTQLSVSEVKCQVCKQISAVTPAPAATQGNASASSGSRSKLPEAMNGRWCNLDNPANWNAWRVNGNRVNTTHHNNTSGSFSFSITGDNTFVVSNVFSEYYTLVDSDTLQMRGVLGSRTLKRCD